MSSTYDVLAMNVVHGVRDVGEVCEMCIYLTRNRVGGEYSEWVTEFGLGFTNPVGTAGTVWDVCLCLSCGGMGCVEGWS